MPSATASTTPAGEPVPDSSLELQTMVTEEGRFVDIPAILLRQPPPKPVEFLYFQYHYESASPLRQDLKKCKTAEDAIDVLATELETMHALVSGYVKNLCTVTARFDEDLAKVREEHASLQANFFFCQNLLQHTNQVLGQLNYGYALLKAKVDLKVSQHAGLQKLPHVKPSNGRAHLVSDPEMTAKQKVRNNDHRNQILKNRADHATVHDTVDYIQQKATVDEIAFPELYEPRSLVKGKGTAKGNARPPFEPHVRVKVEKLTEGLEVMRETFLRVQAKTEREFERMRFLTAGAAKDASEFWELQDEISNRTGLEQGERVKHLKRKHAAYTDWAERPVSVNSTTTTPVPATNHPSSAAYPTPSSSQTPDTTPSQDTPTPNPHLDLPFDPRTSSYAIRISVDHDKPVDELTRDEAIAMLKALPHQVKIVPQAAIVALETEQQLAHYTQKEAEVQTSLEVLAAKLEAEAGIGRMHPDSALRPIVPEKRTEVFGEPWPAADGRGAGPLGTSTPVAKKSSAPVRASVDHAAAQVSTGASGGKGKSRKREREEPGADQLAGNGIEAEGIPHPEGKARSQKNKRVRKA